MQGFRLFTKIQLYAANFLRISKVRSRFRSRVGVWAINVFDLVMKNFPPHRGEVLLSQQILGRGWAGVRFFPTVTKKGYFSAIR